MEGKELNPRSWVDHYGASLYGYALKSVSNVHEAQNLVQETFLSALASRDGFQGRSSERTWLFGILKHKILDHLRKKYKEGPANAFLSEEASVDDLFDESTQRLREPPAEWGQHPAKAMEREEFWAVFGGCMQELPPKSREVFALRELQDADSEDIRKVLGITPTNLWVLLHRARLQLRRCLEEHWFKRT